MELIFSQQSCQDSVEKKHNTRLLLKITSHKNKELHNVTKKNFLHSSKSMALFITENSDEQ